LAIGGSLMAPWSLSNLPGIHKSLYFQRQTQGVSTRFRLARGVRGSVVRPISAPVRVSRLPGDDGVEECRCHPIDTSFLIPHPCSDRPRASRLTDDYPPLNGRRLSSRPIKGGFLHFDRKRIRPQVSNVGQGPLKSQVTECWQVSEFREFQRETSRKANAFCKLLDFRIRQPPHFVQQFSLTLSKSRFDELLPIALLPTRNPAE
jgi:hypothetical protein